MWLPRGPNFSFSRLFEIDDSLTGDTEQGQEKAPEDLMREHGEMQADFNAYA